MNVNDLKAVMYDWIVNNNKTNDFDVSESVAFCDSLLDYLQPIITKQEVDIKIPDPVKRK